MLPILYYGQAILWPHSAKTQCVPAASADNISEPSLTFRTLQYFLVMIGCRTSTCVLIRVGLDELEKLLWIAY